MTKRKIITKQIQEEKKPRKKGKYNINENTYKNAESSDRQ